MSRLGKKPINIPNGVKVEISGENINFTGPKGVVSVKSLPGINFDIKDGNIIISPKNETKQNLMNWGTLWSHSKNAIEGVTVGFSKGLEIEGVGFKVSIEGKNLILKVGFSHLVNFPIPEGISVEVEKNKIKISGINKQQVGHIAASIRKIKKPEPYLGKGIRYEGEVIRRKAGKKAGAATSTK